MRAIIGVNIKVEVQAGVGADKTIQSISADTSGTSTVGSTGHGFSNGDVVVFEMTDGMSQLDGQAARVANKSTDAFQIEGLDVSDYEAFASGTVKKISSFATLSAAQTASAPNAAPAKIDITTLEDKFSKQYAYGLADAPDGSFGCLFNPGGATEAIIDGATVNKTPLALRLTYSDGRQTVMNSNVSGGQGFDIGANDAAKSTVAFTPIKRVMHYEAL